ncbi:MAG: hypothetical protein AAGA32_22265 [Pseudomonadota bacterium]
MRDVGHQTGHIEDDARPAWDLSGPRPLDWSAWYPADLAPDSRAVRHPVFDLGEIWSGARLAAGGAFPVVLLSHGTGGSPESIGWVARSLATEGYIVIGAHHHGNTAGQPYVAEGFLCWWERARDLSALLTAHADRGPFGGRLDLTRVAALGFSLGGHTVLSLAGARSSMERYASWAGTGPFSSGPREFPTLAASLPPLLATSEAMKSSWARQGADYSDTRIKSLVSIAPPPTVRAFDPADIAAIQIPVTLVTGEADVEAPTAQCADWLRACNPLFSHTSVGEHVGHYTFLCQPSADPPEDMDAMFHDAPTVSRAAVHAETSAVVSAALRQSLPGSA